MLGYLFKEMSLRLPETVWLGGHSSQGPWRLQQGGQGRGAFLTGCLAPGRTFWRGCGILWRAWSLRSAGWRSSGPISTAWLLVSTSPLSSAALLHGPAALPILSLSPCPGGAGGGWIRATVHQCHYRAPLTLGSGSGSGTTGHHTLL
ncbi:hypothetical protein H1C71_035498 [Ictidomys tridecemlineatus]|nr:hypothetical protein H1C71_035498 [Ictidomys tridecemlineatus]